MKKFQKRLSNFFLLFLLAFRNLIRQKRRNSLLGFAMAFGLAILIVTSSFSIGISDLFLNKYMVMTSGHLEFSITERAGVKTEIIRDQERYLNFLQNHIQGIKYIREAISTWARVIGIGKAEGLNISGVDKEELDNQRGLYQAVAGSLEEFLSSDDGVMLYEKKAEALNVKIGDTLQAKFNTIHGQSQAARYTVKCILKGGNLFEEITLLVNLSRLKKDLGLDPFETKKLQVILKDVKTAVPAADKLHELLTPRLAVVQTVPNKQGERTLLGCPTTNHIAPSPLFKIERGYYRANKRGEAIVSEEWAKNHSFKLGEKVPFTYETKYQGKRTLNLTITGIFKSDLLKDKVVLLTRTTHFKNYYDYLPRDYDETSIEKWLSSEAFDALEKEWRVLRRSPTTEDLMVKFAELNKYKWQGQAIDIRTMREIGSQMLQLEQGLIFLIVIALTVILGIVVIGIINTLTLSIRERKTEIGTIRSIGMYRGDILVLFVLEYIQLAFFSGLIGIVMALVIMKLLAIPHIEATSSMSLFLYDGHLYFLKSSKSIVAFLLVLVTVTGIAAFLPSYKASKLNPAQALGKYE